MPEDQGDEGMAKGVDTIARHTFTKERQPQAMSELSYHQPTQLSSPDSRLRLRNYWQKNKHILDQAGAQKNRSSVVESS